MALLMAHDYRGNVRELENIIEHAFVLCSEGQIEARHLPSDFAPHVPLESRPGIHTSVRAVEAHVIREALRRNHFSRLATARELGMHKSTLFRKVKALGLALPEEDGRSRHARP